MIDAPLITQWMSPDEVFFRQNFGNLISAINSKTAIHIDSYSVYPTGQQSIVAEILESNIIQPAVLKTSLEPDTIVWESSALRHWGNITRTPQIIDLHQENKEFPATFVILEKIESPRLKETPPQTRIETGLSKQMGQILAKIHLQDTPKDLPVPPPTTPGKISEFTIDKLNVLFNLGLVNDAEKAIVEKAINTIQIKSTQLHLGHGDFLAYNLFNDDGEIVVFDPDVIVADPMLDLANTLVNTVAEVLDFGEQESIEILKGYSSLASVDHELLHAFFIVQCVKKIDKWHLKKLDQKVARTIKLIQSPPNFLR
jgi:fructosamine-3-kinase